MACGSEEAAMGNRQATEPVWENGIIPFKFSGEIEQSRDRPAYDIQAPVGVLGPGVAGNRQDDVRKIQKLLNAISPGDGGPEPRLDEDGFIGPKTIAAIRKFQQARFGWQDGTVEPSHATLVELTTNEADDTTGQPRGVILNAVHQWNRTVGDRVKWVRHTPHRTPQPNYVVIQFVASGKSRRSEGTKPGEQTIVISVGGANGLISAALRAGVPRARLEGIVLHEMGHSAGLAHEHQRSDRDDFVEVVKDNIQGQDPAMPAVEGRRFQIDYKIPTTPPSMPSGGYDFNSMMHYFATQAAREEGLTTMRKRRSFRGQPFPDPQPFFGNLDGFSPGDLATLRSIYPPR
jgi:peptidoglycan hydrolase-like protein with peptidoglycan-binding domain